MPRIEKIRPIGNMDKDSDIINVGKGTGSGNTIDNRNTQISPDSGTGLGSITPTLGNEFAFSLGSVSAQNKRYRVTVSGDPSKSHSIRFLSTKRNVNIITGTGTDGAVDFVGTATSLEASFISAMIATGTSVWITSVSGNSVEFEMTSIPHYDWFLTSTGVDDVQIVCVQEAIPTNLAGPLKDIGSYDLLGDLFIFSTSQDELPSTSDYSIIGVGPFSGGAFIGPYTIITFDSDHNLSAGNWITISNSDAPWLNGVFVVRSIISTTQIEIVTDTTFGITHPSFTVGSEVLTINANGIGEIGVAEKNIDTDTWVYTRLLRSVELNFVARKAIRCDAREKGGDRILYFTDKYNVPRHFSYGGQYIQDGALNFVMSDNQYQYDNITEQVNLLSISSSTYSPLNYIGQSDSGGELFCGNKYYVFRFVDADNSHTNWSSPSRAIPVFPRSLVSDNPLNIKGGEALTQTSKTVNLSVSGIPTGIFDKVEIAVIESDTTGSITGSIFNGITLNEDQQQILFSHRGNETDTVLLDVGEVVTSISDFNIVSKVGDLCIIDKRLVMADISYAQISDLQEWAKTFTHKLEYKKIKGVKDITNKVVGGYVDPDNVFNYPSLTLYETYRIGVDVQFIDGKNSPTFWVDDIRIDTLSSNAANPTDNRRITSGGLPDYVLNDTNSERDINVPHIVFSNIDMSTLIDGRPIGDFISSITFRFAEIKKEVLASGFVIVGISGTETISPVLVDSGNSVGIKIGPRSGSHCQYLDWNSAYRTASPTGLLSDETVRGDLIRHPYPNGFTQQRRTAFFYSPEVSMGDLDGIELTTADKLNVYYPVARSYSSQTTDFNCAYVNSLGAVDTHGFGGTPSKMIGSETVELVASPVSAPLNNQNSNGVIQYDIDELSIMNAGESTILGGVNIDTYHVETSNGISSHDFLYNEFNISHAKCVALRTSSNVLPYSDAYWTANGVDYGVYYAQIFRESPNKYGDLNTTRYQSYGQTFDSDSIQNISTQIKVFGGDSFIVKTILRNRFAKEDQADSPLVPASGAVSSVLNVGRHLGMTYITQSYRNMELVNNTHPVLFSYPESFTGTFSQRWLAWTDVVGEYLQTYNGKYSYGLNQIYRNAYSDELNSSLKDVPTRIMYSTRDVYSSVSDSMTVFLPLDIHDLDGTFGPIISVCNVNGELFTLQPRKYQLQYFNARGSLQTSSSSTEVLIGDGSVLARDGQTLSIYGTSHKWSVIKGVSKGGKDVLYWFNVENGVMMRFGNDGTGVISERGMTSYFANYTKWLKDKNEHAYEQGVRAVWDDRRKEAIWTFTAWRNVSEWQPSTSFLISTPIGTVVTNPNAQSDSYEGFPMIFRCKVAHVNQPSNEPFVGIDWQQYWDKIDYNDSNYYSIFTICFNEITNGFRCFYGHLPKTYLKWQNTFLSSHPTKRNLIFEHRKGEYTTWYGVQNASPIIQPKIEDAYFESVVNDVPEQNVRAVAVSYLSEKAPDRVEYRTDRHYTWDTSSEFEKNDDSFFAPIRDDASVNGSPDLDGEPLSGSYVRIKFIFFGGAYNKLSSMVVKMFDRLRRISR